MIETRLGRVKDPVARFFGYAIEREAIRIRREVHGWEPVFTEDPILQLYRFCNVYREDDRTTRWFKKYVREPLRDKPEVLLATVLFRWFNRITTGEAVFCQESLYRDGPGTAWEEYLRCGKTNVLLHAIKQVCGKGPYVTGSYTVLGKRGMTKLPGCLWGVNNFNKGRHSLLNAGLGEDIGWKDISTILLVDNTHNETVQSLEWIWGWLRQFDYLGDFTAYEVVTDLRHTALLERATDVLTWTNPGPGARRGLNRMHGRELTQTAGRARMIEEINLLLIKANQYWPTEIEGAKTCPWEMREVEHTLCEWDKYERARLGQGRPRGVFK